MYIDFTYISVLQTISKIDFVTNCISLNKKVIVTEVLLFFIEHTHTTKTWISNKLAVSDVQQMISF